MREVLMGRGARRVVETCARLRRGERLLIVTDFERAAIARALAAAGHAAGAETVVAIMEPRPIDNAEPPAAVAAAMREADVVLLPVSKSIAHSAATKEALRAGARVLSLTAFTEEQLMGGGIEADFEREKPRCDRVAAALTEGKRLRLTTPAGTDLALSLEGRKGNSHACLLLGRGTFSGVPNIEANIAPLEGTAEGRVVVDGSVPYYGVGVVREPIRMEVRRGAVVSIEGGEQARFLRDLLAAQGDPNVYNIAQFAVGLNPFCTELTGVMLNDEGCLGTVHIGIGTSSNLGGTVRAATHFDAILRTPTVEVDGCPLLREGQVLL